MFRALLSPVVTSTPSLTRVSPRTVPRLAAFALATAGVLSLTTVLCRAADLYDDAPTHRSGSAYDDPRYADIYGATPPIPHERVYRYDDQGPAHRYSGGCVPKAEISLRLENDGWHGFNNPRVIGDGRATVDAFRPNGRPFRLEVDRCSGEVLAARPIEAPRYHADADPYGYYAYGDRGAARPY